MVAPIPVVSTDMRRLAIGCLYLLTRKATLEWPTSTAAHPSYFVKVTRTAQGPFREGHNIYFPFMVPTAQWHEAVVPVLQNKDLQVYVMDNPSLRVHPNLILIAIEQVDVLIEKIEFYLLESFIAAGFLPESFSPSAAVAEEGAPTGGPAEETPPGEPIVWNPLNEGAPDIDLHPDGTPRLSYRIVD